MFTKEIRKNTKENKPSDHFCSHFLQEGRIDLIPWLDCCIFFCLFRQHPYWHMSIICWWPLRYRDSHMHNVRRWYAFWCILWHPTVYGVPRAHLQSNLWKKYAWIRINFVAYFMYRFPFVLHDQMCFFYYKVLNHICNIFWCMLCLLLP